MWPLAKISSCEMSKKLIPLGRWWLNTLASFYSVLLTQFWFPHVADPISWTKVPLRNVLPSWNLFIYCSFPENPTLTGSMSWISELKLIKFGLTSFWNSSFFFLTGPPLYFVKAHCCVFWSFRLEFNGKSIFSRRYRYYVFCNINGFSLRHLKKKYEYKSALPITYWF